MKRKMLSLIAFTYSICYVNAQIKLYENPKSLEFKNQIKSISEVPKIIMDTFDIEAYKLSVKNSIPLQFAKSFDVKLDIKKSGLRENVDSGTIWRLLIKSNKAYSVNLIFSQYKLGKKARLYLVV